MTQANKATWLPKFGGQKWKHQSFVLHLTPDDEAAPPRCAVPARKWAMGSLELTDNPDDGTAVGELKFPPEAAGLKLQVKVECTAADEKEPALFEATGTGLVSGPLEGCVYKLIGWAFPDASNQVEFVRGAIQAVRGMAKAAGIEPGKEPIPTVGLFILKKAS